LFFLLLDITIARPKITEAMQISPADPKIPMSRIVLLSSIFESSRDVTAPTSLFSNLADPTSSFGSPVEKI